MHSTKMIPRRYPAYLFHDEHRHHSLGMTFRRIQAFCSTGYLNHLEQRQSEEPQEAALQVLALDHMMDS